MWKGSKVLSLVLTMLIAAQTPVMAEVHIWDKTSEKIMSLNAAEEKELEEEAVSWLLQLYKDLSKEFHAGNYENYERNLNQGLLSGAIPSFGELSAGSDGSPEYSDSSAHFYEVCGGAFSSLGYARIDINRDGTEELIIGYCPEDSSSFDATDLYAAYSVKGGEIRTIFQGWSRSFYWLTEDGSIMMHADSGYMDYEYIKYDLIEEADGEFSLKEKEALVVEGTAYPDEPYFYYPSGRVIVGLDKYGWPEYSNDNVVQLNEEYGKKFHDYFNSELLHINLERFDDPDD